MNATALAPVRSLAPATAEDRARRVLGACIGSKRSPATRRAYASDLRHLAAYLGADCDDAGAALALLAAGPSEVVGWRDAMEGAGLAPATVARRLAAVRTFYRFAAAEGLTDRNPAELVEAPRVEAARQRAPVLEAAGARKLLDAPDLGTLRGMRDRAILGLLACSGLRRAEVAGIRAGDVRRTDAGLTATVDGKGGKVRTVDVDRGTAEALCAYLAADGRTLGTGAPSAPLFLGTGHRADSGGLSVDSVDHLVRVHARAAGVEADAGAVAPHALRRTFATVAIDRGASLEALRRAMGHSDPRTTARYDRRREATVTVTY